MLTRVATPIAPSPTDYCSYDCTVRLYQYASKVLSSIICTVPRVPYEYRTTVDVDIHRAREARDPESLMTTHSQPAERTQQAPRQQQQHRRFDPQGRSCLQRTTRPAGGEKAVASRDRKQLQELLQSSSVPCCNSRNISAGTEQVEGAVALRRARDSCLASRNGGTHSTAALDVSTCGSQARSPCWGTGPASRKGSRACVFMQYTYEVRPRTLRRCPKSPMGCAGATPSSCNIHDLTATHSSPTRHMDRCIPNLCTRHQLFETHVSPSPAWVLKFAGGCSLRLFPEGGEGMSCCWVKEALTPRNPKRTTIIRSSPGGNLGASSSLARRLRGLSERGTPADSCQNSQRHSVSHSRVWTPRACRRWWAP